MSGYVAVQWSRTKYVYDAWLIGGVILYLAGFMLIEGSLHPPKNQAEWIDLRIRAFGTCAFLMLSIILCIGPLARLNPRFLPLLYNRRHFGVLMFLVACVHAWSMVEWFITLGVLPSLVDELTNWPNYLKFIGFPFKTLGLAALFILLLMASTSHDYWLAVLKPPVWKALHMAVYVAYGLVVIHVALGAMQTNRGLGIPIMLVVSLIVVSTLHILAGCADAPSTAASRRARRAGSRSGRRCRSATSARRSWPPRAASASPSSATATRSARSAMSAPTRTGRSAKARSSTG